MKAFFAIIILLFSAVTVIPIIILIMEAVMQDGNDSILRKLIENAQKA